MRADVTAICAEIEDEYSRHDRPRRGRRHPATPAVQPIIQAVREAAINAAKHSGEDQFAVYVEVGATEIIGLRP